MRSTMERGADSWGRSTSSSPTHGPLTCFWWTATKPIGPWIACRPSWVRDYCVGWRGIPFPDAPFVLVIYITDFIVSDGEASSRLRHKPPCCRQRPTGQWPDTTFHLDCSGRLETRIRPCSATTGSWLSAVHVCDVVLKAFLSDKETVFREASVLFNLFVHLDTYGIKGSPPYPSRGKG